MQRTSSAIASPPATAMTATASRGPSSEASTPISMLPAVDSIWLILKSAMVRPRYSADEYDCTTVFTSAFAYTWQYPATIMMTSDSQYHGVYAKTTITAA